MGINFRTIYLEKNEGHGNARRKAVANSTNELIALMDADDISYDFRFEKQLNYFINDNELDIVGGQITEFIDIPTNIISRRKVPECDFEIKKYMKKRCPMNQVTVMFKKKFYDKVGGYIDWYCEEDYYLWLRMALCNGKFANVKEDLVNVRIGNEMSSRRGGMKYFISEYRIQKFMLRNKIISRIRFLYNVLLRFGGEVILNDKMRTKVFKLIRNSPQIIIKSNSDVNRNTQNNIKYPKFSVAMCVYNGDDAKYFDSALKSILNQTVKPDEIVLVIDGPVSILIEDVICKYRNLCKQI